MFGWFKKKNAQAAQKPLQTEQRPSVRGRYDLQFTTDENARLWELTDAWSAKTANSFHARRMARMRTRYEIQNNSYARGLTLTLANDLIGTGPRLCVKGEDEESNEQVQRAFGKWMSDIHLSEKLRTMKLAKTGDGEGIALLVNNPESVNPVQLDVKPIESDQVTSPMQAFQAKDWVDGMELNDMGDASVYHVLKKHPGDLFWGLMNPLEYDRVPARNVLFWFRVDRPGQVRGWPEIAPAIELFAKLRRYTTAVIDTAEKAACHTGVIESENPADNEEPPTPFERLEIARGMMMNLPWGTKMSSFPQNEPTTTYEMFVRLILREVGRCLHIPFNIAAGDSSGYNYSSGRLDHLLYHRAMRVERDQLERLLGQIFRAWADEAVMIPGLLPDGLDIENMAYCWYWDPVESIDPEKDNAADALALESNTGTMERIWMERYGENWKEGIKQRGRERKLMLAEGLIQEEPAGEGDENPNKQADEALDDDLNSAGVTALKAGWITLPNGVHVELDSSGKVRRGPTDLKNKTPAEFASHRAEEHQKAAEKAGGRFKSRRTHADAAIAHHKAANAYKEAFRAHKQAELAHKQAGNPEKAAQHKQAARSARLKSFKHRGRALYHQSTRAFNVVRDTARSGVRTANTIKELADTARKTKKAVEQLQEWAGSRR